ANAVCIAGALLSRGTTESSGLEKMKIEKKKCLMIFIEDTDMWKGDRLYEVIVRLLHRHGLEGATAVSGIGGFGGLGQIHRKGLFGVSDEKPVVIFAIDSEAKVRKAIDAVTPLIEGGLICAHDTEVFTREQGASRF